MVSFITECRWRAVGVERWSECRPKHVAENIVNKIHYIILKCILLVIYIFFNYWHNCQIL